jgi:hypothetical protein
MKSFLIVLCCIGALGLLSGIILNRLSKKCEVKARSEKYYENAKVMRLLAVIGFMSFIFLGTCYLIYTL